MARGVAPPQRNTPTPQQAARELGRRKLPQDRRHEGRTEAIECGAFFRSAAELELIAARRPA